MTAIVFRNKGLIDIRAVTTFGVSAKEGANPIGMFGTGLKYAISIILRHGGKISVWRGGEQFKFTVEQAEIRGKEFGVVQMNGVDLGFTTHVGMGWEPWMAFREIYCNMLDEGGGIDLIPDRGTIAFGLDETVVVVEDFIEFEEAFHKRSAFVLSDQPFMRLIVKGVYVVDLREGNSRHLYYRGVLAAEIDRVAEYTYSITAPLMLTEDRTIKSMYQAMSILAEGITTCEHVPFIMRVLQAPVDSFEHSFDLGYAQNVPSEVFLDCIEEAKRDGSMPLNKSAIALLTKHRVGLFKPEDAVLTHSEQLVLDQACAIMRAMNFEIDKYPIVVLKTLNNGKSLGMAAGEVIYLSYRAFTIGDNTVLGTLIEEYLHLDHLFSDESRDFQNFLMDRVASMARQLHQSATYGAKPVRALPFDDVLSKRTFEQAIAARHTPF